MKIDGGSERILRTDYGPMGLPGRDALAQAVTDEEPGLRRYIDPARAELLGQAIEDGVDAEALRQLFTEDEIDSYFSNPYVGPEAH